MPFELDRFQREAIAQIDQGRSVLVAAPTGAGKTVVAEHAVERALGQGRKAFYTTPIKALSNQKYADLIRTHGPDRVGLLTGDNAVHGDAPVVVMTTEVLRNMVYAASPALNGLEVVVLDEVHYLQDAYRGPVWEEVIVHLPAEVKLVCLSATVSNADELAAWIQAVRGPTATVVETNRPVELVNHYLARDKHAPELVMLPTLVAGKPNPQCERMDNEALSMPRHLQHRNGGRRRFSTPRRVEVAERLADDQLLPAIYFIFSRNGCRDAARALTEAGVRLTEPGERPRIRQIVEERTAALTDSDLDLLDYDLWLAGLEQGIATHHAGMVPPFKEAVEACFVEGLVKVVFATETLALGINMPARSVVIETLTKFTGERHEFLTPAEFTQLTGRAGRRGLDPVGHAVVLWSPFVAFDQVAALALSRRFALTSSFRPTYNMAANLVRRYPRQEAMRLLNQSFAQFQADRSLVTLERRRSARLEQVEELSAETACDRGDVAEYRALLRAQAATPPVTDRGQRVERDPDGVHRSLEKLKPGDVVVLDGDRLAVLTVAHRRGGAVKLTLVDPDGQPALLGESDFDEPPRRRATMTLPVPFLPNDKAYRRSVGRSLSKVRLDSGRRQRSFPPPAHNRPTGASVAHPVAGCPDIELHLRAAEQVDRLSREVTDLEKRIESRGGSIGRRFQQVLELLESFGYVDRDTWRLTARGRLLSSTYHESDLLVAEALSRGLFDGLDTASLAGLASCVTYEHRSKEAPPAPWFPSAALRERAVGLADLAAELNQAERAARLPETRAPDPTFFALAHAWASDQDLADVLEDEDLSGGDFVRNIKQLIDLLRQVGDHAPEPETARTARQAAESLLRGIVAASSVSTATEPPLGDEEASPVDATARPAEEVG